MKRASQFVYLVGGYQVGNLMLNFGRTLYNTEYEQISLKTRLNSSYGSEGEWAIVTGASEGIGKAYAMELA